MKQLNWKALLAFWLGGLAVLLSTVLGYWIIALVIIPLHLLLWY